ncbi:hypothetical protein NC651_002085 [Populus alba x Populus x berolinensis]|nr:hypothetical protein NC651_002085 [Populus alba x Populus x berolinensis]
MIAIYSKTAEDLAIEEGSQNREQLREEDDLETEIEGDDLGIEDIDLPEGNDLEDNCEQTV